MLTIILGIGIAAALIFIGAYFDWEENFTCVTALFVVIAGIMLAFAPLCGYEQAEVVQEIELVSLSNTVASEGEGNLIYVSVSAGNVYSYRYKVENTTGLSGNAYETNTVSSNVTEVESDECTQPLLIVYVSKAKSNLFCFGIGKVKSYVFYVPTGTISKEINLS
ncbi:MAG: hypothetical protein IJ272_09295 [Clostridia bacterium]|nr:hypothetical protein [Clostridia bacterium]